MMKLTSMATPMKVRTEADGGEDVQVDALHAGAANRNGDRINLARPSQ
jgi:hypothetical protein